jgi:hypothetical protein
MWSFFAKWYALKLARCATTTLGSEIVKELGGRSVDSITRDKYLMPTRHPLSLRSCRYHAVLWLRRILYRDSIRRRPSLASDTDAWHAPLLESEES